MNTEYVRLLEAIASELFDADKAGTPVYTLPESSALALIAERADLNVHDALDEICRVVRSTLYLDEQGTSPLRWHTTASARHLRKPLETPPSLPLLLVLSIAAEAMHAGEEMAANNFYGRVSPLLGIPPAREDRFIGDYQRHADLLWRSLNAWLEAWEGERGVPTAYSLGGMRHVGLPMSQAVVRRHDRLGLIEAFEEEGLPPGLRMSAEDMEVALQASVTSIPSPLSSNLRRLWPNLDARARIVQAACLELESWTGSSSLGKPLTRAGSVRLVAYLRSFPRAQLELNLAIPCDEAAAEVKFISADGDVPISVLPGSPGVVRLASTDTVSPESLVGDVVQGHVTDAAASSFVRRPRRVVPMRWDELEGAYLEMERVAVGELNLVLALNEVRGQVARFLTENARPGWDLAEEMRGLPENWVLFQKVQVMAVPSSRTHLDLTPLVARSRSSLTMRGGFDLPGRLRKWSSLEPPEVTGYSVGAHSVQLRVYKGDLPKDESLCASSSVEGDVSILELSRLDLPDGEYLATMFVDNDARPRSNAIIRLRSADSPLHRVDDADMKLVYSPESGALWPLSAGPADWSSYINGPRVMGSLAEGGSPAAMPDFFPKERRASPGVARPRVRVGSPYAPDSCMVTGRHRFELPPALGSRPPARTIEGECTTCGLVKRFAATARAATKANIQTAGRGLRQVQLSRIESNTASDQRVLLDALCHVGQGSRRDFDRIAAHVEGSGLYSDRCLRANEVLGHIDVRRDEQLRAIDWAINAPTLVRVEGDGFALVGFRSRTLVAALREWFGRETVMEQHTGAGPRLLLKAEHDVLDARADDLADLGVSVQSTSPALEIAAALPPLSRIERELFRIPVPGFRTLEWWDPRSASWLPGTSMASVGAFRIFGFQSLYVVRSRLDLDEGTVAVGTAQLVKHIASMWAADPLVGYHTRSTSVLMPLGADLPALYGRALVMCSQWAPLEHPRNRLIQYRDVPRSVADVVFDRLTR